MDPNALADRLSSALAIHRDDVLLSESWCWSFNDLTTWLMNGGFPPDDESVDRLLELLDSGGSDLAERYNELADLLR